MSDKTIKSRYIIPIILFLFLISFVNAQDFNILMGENPGALCSGSTGVFTDVVENNDVNNLEFTISTGGSAVPFSVSVPQAFTLMPGKKKTIYTYVSPRTTTAFGKYTLDIIVNTNGKTRSISHTIEVKDCYDFNLEVTEPSKNVCPSDTEKFNFKISNSGYYTETYDLSIEGNIADWITLSEKAISIDSNEVKDVYAYVTAPKDSLGNYEFTLTAISRTTKKVKTLKTALTVDPCFDLSLITEKDYYSLCEHSTQVVPITIENKGSVDNVYKISIDGPSWASLENNRVEISKGTSASTNLVLNPDYGVEGDMQVLISIITEKGGFESKNTLSVHVDKCYASAVDIEKDFDKICNSLSSTYSVAIKNTGKYEQEFSLSLLGPEWSSLGTSRVTLGSDEEQLINLEISPGFDAPAGDYDITVRVEAMDTSKVFAEDTIKISTISREECYQPSIGIKNKEVSVYYDSAATIPVIIENKGSEQATYNIGVSGTSASFVQLNPGILTIDPGKAELVYLYIAPTSQTKNGGYTATISVRLEDTTILASDDISIIVTESKVGEEEIITPEEPKLSLADRIKNFFKRLFGKKQVEQPVEEIPIIPPEENITEEIPEEEVPEEEVIPPETLDISTEAKESLAQSGQITTLIIDGEEHSAEVIDVREDSVTMIIQSDPVYLDLSTGESEEVDLDGDGINDVKVTFNGYVDGKASLTYEKIEVQAPAEEVTPEENITEEIPENITTPIEQPEKEKVPGFFTIYRNYIIAGVVILIIIIVFIRARLGKKIVDFFEEEVEEVEEKKPVKKEKEEKKEEKKKPVKKEEKKKKEVDEDEYY